MALFLASQHGAAHAHLRAHPRDALIAQLSTGVFGLTGFSAETGRQARLPACTETLLPHYPGDWWMMSMHAILLCETGRIAQSRALMDEALALNPHNAKGAHFKAHAQYEAGETEAGRAVAGCAALVHSRSRNAGSWGERNARISLPDRSGARRPRAGRRRCRAGARRQLLDA